MHFARLRSSSTASRSLLLICAIAILQPATVGSSNAATLEVRVASSSDDAEEPTGGAVALSSSDLELIQDSAAQTVAMRWLGLSIPPGSTITAAYIQFSADESQSEATSLVIRGQAADNASTFVTTAGNLSTRPLTTANASWAPVAWTAGEIGANQRTTDLSAVIQEIVSRPGWASGNALAIIITGSGHRTAVAYNGNALSAPLLHVEFAAIPPPENPPVARLSVVQVGPLMVTADASASTDVDATPIASYQFDFGDLTPVVTTFAPAATATHTYATSGFFTVTVIATDTGNNASSPATVSITVSALTSNAVDVRVAASADDAEEPLGGTANLTSNDLELIRDNANQTVGMRWTGLAIPPGATITAAYVQFAARLSDSEVTNLVIRGQAADNAATFVRSLGNIATRPLTTAAGSWVPAPWTAGESGVNQRTPGLVAVVQEIVSRPGWASGNALALIVSGAGRRTAWSYNGQAASAPLLHLEFTGGPPPPDSPPVARLSLVQAASPPRTVVADGSASTDADLTPIASYRFDFGDGTPAVTTLAPVATATHTYADVGSYVVTLVATDTGGLPSSPVTATIIVSPPTDDPPIARLSVAQVATPPLSVRADASLSTDVDVTPIASYTFDFGDLTPDVTTAAPTAIATHSYATAGTYTISVRVTDTAGQVSAPASVSIAVATGFQSTVEQRVAAASDDAEEPAGSTVSLSSSDLELIQDSAAQTVGIRWTGLAIPAGATITAAYVQFKADESQSEATNLVIRGQAADNATTFATAAGNISTRARTTAAASWAPVPWTAGEVGANQRTPDLSAVVQEVVSRSGWASGNALALIFTGSGHRTAVAYDGSAAVAPLLHVELLSSVPPPDNPPVARLSVAQAASPPLTVVADGSASTDADLTPIASYQFSFGDGTAAVTTAAPVATATHTYATAGTYTVALIATDTGGQASSPATTSITLGSGTASQVAVYAGYYDTHHPNLLQPKPDPWRGSPNVTFVGTPDPGTTDDWDSSALRIDNLGTTTLTGVVVTVDMGSASFALWGTRSIAPGTSLILAQTAFENFDGSDTSPAGCYDCNPNLCLTAVSSVRPVVRVTINGTPTDYVDTDQIMNTRGVDGAGCPYTGTRNDESHAWQRIYPPAAGPNQAAPDSSGPHALNTSLNRSLSLAPLFPNPTRGDLEFKFSTPKRGAVRLGVYDVKGRMVKPLVDDVLASSDYHGHVRLDGLAAGIYFFTLWTPEAALHRKLVIVR